jgi:hypothetical protein
MKTRQQQRHHNPDRHPRGKFCRFPSPSLRQPFSLKSLFFLLTAASLLALHPALPCQGQADYADAYEQSRNEFKAVQESVAATKSTLDASKIVIDKAEAQLRLNIQQLQKANKPVPENLKNAAARFKNARMTLKRSQGMLENFGDYSGKITAVTDVYDKVIELRAKMQEDSQLMGDLAGALRAIGTLMVEGADYVPVIGKAVGGYGTIAIGMVDKLGGLAKLIDSNRNQGQIGRGTHSIGDRNKIFREFQLNHPELKADVYTPSVPAYLYEPFGGPSEGNSVIWDEETRQFSIVPADIPARDIFRMTLLLQTRLSAAELKILMEHWKTVGAPHLKAARGLHTLLNSVRHGPFIDVVSRADRTSNGFLFRLLQDPDLFEALYVFDPETRADMHRSLKAVHDGLVAEGALDLAERLRTFAGKHKLGIAFTGPEPVAPKKPVQKKAEKKKEPGTAGTKTAAPELKKKQEAKKVAPVPPKPKPAAKTPPPVPPKPKNEVKKAAKTPAAKPPPKKPSVKAGQVVGSCSACIQNGMDCACGKAACRCCAKGDKNCNAFDL